MEKEDKFFSGLFGTNVLDPCSVCGKQLYPQGIYRIKNVGKCCRACYLKNQELEKEKEEERKRQWKEQQKNVKPRSIYDIKRELIYNHLKAALESNYFDSFIMGGGLCIKKHYEDGTEAYDITMSVMAIYDYYKNNKDSKIDVLFYETLLKKSTTGLSSEILADLLDIVRYQMYMESIGQAPFKIDCWKILDAIEQHIENHRDIFDQHTIGRPASIDKSFPEYFAEVKKDVMERFKKQDETPDACSVASQPD